MENVVGLPEDAKQLSGAHAYPLQLVVNEARQRRLKGRPGLIVPQEEWFPGTMRLVLSGPNCPFFEEEASPKIGIKRFAQGICVQVGQWSWVFIMIPDIERDITLQARAYYSGIHGEHFAPRVVATYVGHQWTAIGLV